MLKIQSPLCRDQAGGQQQSIVSVACYQVPDGCHVIPLLGRRQEGPASQLEHIDRIESRFPAEPGTIADQYPIHSRIHFSASWSRVGVARRTGRNHGHCREHVDRTPGRIPTRRWPADRRRPTAAEPRRDLRVHDASRSGHQPNRPESSEEAAARTHLADWYGRDGVVAETDAAGNLILRRHGADPKRPTVLFGSHLDTVVHGGRLDGTYGVIAACEVLRTLTRLELDLPNEPVAVAFSNEEGARFPCPFFGSLAMTGQLDVGVTAMTDQDGISLALGAPGRGGRPGSPGVRGLAGRVDRRLSGAAHRAGTGAGGQGRADRRRRRDHRADDRGHRRVRTAGTRGHDTDGAATRRAGRGAQVVLLVERLSTELGLCAVSTVGCVAAEPNVTNVIPGMVRLTAEIRDARTERLRVAEQALVRELTAIAANTGTHIEARPRQVADRPTPIRCSATRSVRRPAISGCSGSACSAGQDTTPRSWRRSPPSA